MDPSPEAPRSDSLLLGQANRTAPFTSDRPLSTSAQREQVALKRLRRPKERQPVAQSVVPELIMSVSRSQISVPIAPAQPGLPPAPPAPSAPTVPTIFDGGVDNGTSIPPDTAGAVGPNHIFNPLNNNVWIFDRAGVSSAQTISLDGFWNGLGNTGDSFDPRVVFDPSFGGRYIFASMADAHAATSRLLVAVSTTNDPRQPFVSHAIQVDDAAQGEVWLDYPTVGFTADKITVQVNLFTRFGDNFAGSTIYAIDKASIYNPPHQAPVQRFILTNKGGTHVPVVTHDANVGDQFLLARWGGNIGGQGFLVIFRLAGSVALGNATLTQVGFVATPLIWDAFAPGDIGPQIGTQKGVSVGDDRILSGCLRNGKLYCCHTIMLPAGNPTRSAVQWWEIDASNLSVLQTGRIDDPSGAVFFSSPSMAVNSQNDLLIGHAQFSANIHPSGAFMLRTAGNPPQPSNVFAPGKNTYFKTFGGTSNRWGDYSHTQVDPVNDRDFWTLQEYAGANADSWATKWARVVLPPAPVV